MTAEFSCAYCGASNDCFIDPTGGDRQSYVEDCRVCCRPNLLRIAGNADRDEFRVSASPEND